jgi:small nuclear ribonucleoprotein (snRNP)-like protein
VEMHDGRTHRGKLLAIDEHLNLILGEVAEDVHKAVINGAFIKELRLLEKPFPLKELADRLERVFPGAVRLREDISAILVLDKVKVTEEGVVEGTGLVADRARAVFDEFVRELKKSQE